MNRLPLIAVAVLGTAGLVANFVLIPGPPPRAPRPAAPVAAAVRPPDAIATVGGRSVTLADVGVRIDTLGSATPAEAHAAIRAALDAELDGELLAAEAAALGIALSDDDRAALRAREPAPAVLERQLAAAGTTLDAWRAARERDLLGQRVLDRAVYAHVHVSDTEVEAHVARHRVRYRSPDRYQLSAIFVSSPAGTAPTHAAAAAAKVERARAALARRPFADVAREFSDALEGARGGDLGPVAVGAPPLDDPQLAAAVAALAPGETSPAVRTAAGTWILRLDAHLPPADLPLDAVRADATAALVRERGATRARAYLDGLRARGQVVILLPDPDDGTAGDGTAGDGTGARADRTGAAAIRP